MDPKERKTFRRSGKAGYSFDFIWDLVQGRCRFSTKDTVRQAEKAFVMIDFNAMTKGILPSRRFLSAKQVAMHFSDVDTQIQDGPIR